MQVTKNPNTPASANQLQLAKERSYELLPKVLIGVKSIDRFINLVRWKDCVVEQAMRNIAHAPLGEHGGGEIKRQFNLSPPSSSLSTSPSNPQNRRDKAEVLRLILPSIQPTGESCTFERSANIDRSSPTIQLYPMMKAWQGSRVTNSRVWYQFLLKDEEKQFRAQAI